MLSLYLPCTCSSPSYLEHSLWKGQATGVSRDANWQPGCHLIGSAGTWKAEVGPLHAAALVCDGQVHCEGSPGYIYGHPLCPLLCDITILLEGPEKEASVLWARILDTGLPAGRQGG